MWFSFAWEACEHQLPECQASLPLDFAVLGGSLASSTLTKLVFLTMLKICSLETDLSPAFGFNQTQHAMRFVFVSWAQEGQLASHRDFYPLLESSFVIGPHTLANACQSCPLLKLHSSFSIDRAFRCTLTPVCHDYTIKQEFLVKALLNQAVGL